MVRGHGMVTAEHEVGARQTEDRAGVVLSVLQNLAHPFLHGHLPGLPDELADGDDTRHPHPAQQDDEHSTDVCQTQLVRCAA